MSSSSSFFKPLSASSAASSSSSSTNSNNSYSPSFPTLEPKNYFNLGNFESAIHAIQTSLHGFIFAAGKGDKPSPKLLVFRSIPSREQEKEEQEENNQFEQIDCIEQTYSHIFVQNLPLAVSDSSVVDPEKCLVAVALSEASSSLAASTKPSYSSPDRRLKGICFFTYDPMETAPQHQKIGLVDETLKSLIKEPQSMRFFDRKLRHTKSSLKQQGEGEEGEEENETKGGGGGGVQRFVDTKLLIAGRDNNFVIVDVETRFLLQVIASGIEESSVTSMSNQLNVTPCSNSSSSSSSSSCHLLLNASSSTKAKFGVFPLCSVSVDPSSNSSSSSSPSSVSPSSATTVQPLVAKSGKKIYSFHDKITTSTDFLEAGKKSIGNLFDEIAGDCMSLDFSSSSSSWSSSSYGSSQKQEGEEREQALGKVVIGTRNGFIFLLDATFSEKQRQRLKRIIMKGEEREQQEKEGYENVFEKEEREQAEGFPFLGYRFLDEGMQVESGHRSVSSVLFSRPNNESIIAPCGPYVLFLSAHVSSSSVSSSSTSLERQAKLEGEGDQEGDNDDDNKNNNNNPILTILCRVDLRQSIRKSNSMNQSVDGRFIFVGPDSSFSARARELYPSPSKTSTVASEEGGKAVSIIAFENPVRQAKREKAMKIFLIAHRGKKTSLSTALSEIYVLRVLVSHFIKLEF